MSEEEDYASRPEGGELGLRNTRIRSSKNALAVKNSRVAKPRFIGDGIGDGESDAEDLFGDLDALPDRLASPPAAKTQGTAIEVDQDDDLWNGGGELEVIKKARRAVARMDEIRLLSDVGFPALIKSVKRFKSKGKGQTKADLDRLMTMYQLWGHEMYPRTNLVDTLTSVERLCHKRAVVSSMKTYREDFKNGIAPKSTAPARELSPNYSAMLEEMEETNKALPIPKRVELQEEDGFGNEEEFAALFPPIQSAGAVAPVQASTSVSFYGSKSVVPEEPEEDFYGDEVDEDAFLAELEAAAASAPLKKAIAEVEEMEVENDGFNSEEERMLLEMDELM